jgi:ABC-type sugar transport systems, permease components
LEWRSPYCFTSLATSFLKKIDRVALVIPLATTFAVVGLMGRLMFNRDFGVLNYLWSLVFGQKVDWLADPNLAFISISIMEDWQWTPFCALILFSSLTMVPLEIEEAARLETEKWWHILWKVQLPFMLPGITIILILRTADILKLFDVVYTMTRGGPGSATELVSVYIQRIGFSRFLIREWRPPRRSSCLSWRRSYPGST